MQGVPSSNAHEETIYSLIQQLKNKLEKSRESAALELRELVAVFAVDHDIDTLLKFLRNIHKQIFELVNSNDAVWKNGAVLAIDALIDIEVQHSALNVAHFANYLRKLLPGNGASSDLDLKTLRIAAQALSRLAIPGGTLTTEFVDFEIKRALEYLQSPVNPAANSLVSLYSTINTRRYSSVLILSAFSISSAALVYPYVPQILDLIWFAVKEEYEVTRREAVKVIALCLNMLQKRENRERKRWIKQVIQEVEGFLQGPGVPQIHGGFLVLQVLLERNELLLVPKYQQLSQSIFRYAHHSSPIIRKTVIASLPSIALFSPDAFAQQYLADVMAYLLKRVTVDTDKYEAFEALGKICRILHVYMDSYKERVMFAVKDGLLPRGKTKVTTNTMLQASIFKCTGQICITFGPKIKKFLKERLLDLMFACGLSEDLRNCLILMVKYVKDVKRDVLDRLLNEISLILLGKGYFHPGEQKDGQMYNKTKTMKELRSAPEIVDQNTILLALSVLGSLNNVETDGDDTVIPEFRFDFKYENYTLNYLVFDVSAKYLEDDVIIVRKQATIACINVVRGMLEDYRLQSTKDANDGLVDGIENVNEYGTEIIMKVFEKILSVGVSDNDSSIRKEVLVSLTPHFDALLSQSENLKLLFIAVNDEFYAVQEPAIKIIGRLKQRNPGLILPHLRKLIQWLLNELESSSIARQKEESADMLAHTVSISSRIIKPYTASIVSSTLPLSKSINSSLAAKAISVFGQLAHTSREAFLPYVDTILPILVEALQDQSSQSKREAAVRTLGQIVEGTGKVVDPYYKFPELLGILLRMVKTEGNERIRGETVKTLGILGALDPYIYTGILEKTIETTRKEDTSLNFASGPLTNEYYSSVVIDALIKILEDMSLANHHAGAVQALIYIFKTMGLKCVPYLQKIIPALLTMIKSSPITIQHFHFPQLAILISIVKVHIRPHLDSILTLLVQTFSEATSIPSLQVSLLSVTMSITSSLAPEDVRSLLPKIFGSIINVLETDTSETKAPTLKVMQCLSTMSASLEEHIRLVMPLILRVIENLETPASVRVDATKTIISLIKYVKVADVSSRVLIPLSRCLGDKDAREVVVECICAIAAKMGSEYLVFSPVVEKAIQKHRIRSDVYNKVVEDLRSEIPVTFESSSRITITSEETTEITLVKLPVNPAPIKRILDAAIQPRSSRSEWVEWVQRLAVELLRESPAHPLRACASLATSYSPLSRTLFNVGFVSCWNEISKTTQEEMIRGLKAALDSPTIPPEVLTTLLNVAEFMEREADNPLPIEIGSLADYAIGCHAYAKALHYMEQEFFALTNPVAPQPNGSNVSPLLTHQMPDNNGSGTNIRTIDTVETIITLNDNLQLPDSAEGMLENAQMFYGVDVIKESWYEKLSRWEDGLKAYERRRELEKQRILPNGSESDATHNFEENEEATLGRMRCLHNLGEWDKILDELEEDNEFDLDQSTGQLSSTGSQRFGPFYNLTNMLQTISVPSPTSPTAPQNMNLKFTSNVKAELATISLAASAAWGLGRWDTMRKYVNLLSQATTNPDSVFFVAILAIHDGDYEKGLYKINETRELLDKELVALVGESYERSYGVMVRLQMLSELEEVITWKRAEDDLTRMQIKQTWMKRLLRCQQNVEVWQRIMKVRSLVIPPKADIDTQIRFASLCRKSDRPSLALKVLSGLLDNGPQNFTEMEVISGPPKVIYSCLKFLWHYNKRERAFNQMRELSRSLAERLGIFGALNADNTGGIVPVDNLVPTGGELLRLLSKCYRKLGEWQNPESETPTEASLMQALRFLRSAVRCDSKHHKTWHTWGMAQFNTLTYYEQTIPETERGNLTELVITSHAIPAIEGFLRSIALSPSAEGNSLQDILRLLTLWFKCGNHTNVNEAMKIGFKQVSINTWLQVIPQLIGKIHVPNLEVRRIVHQLLLDVGKAHPQAIIYSLTVASKSPNVSRKNAANQIMDLLRAFYPNLVDQALLVSNELVRVAILWHELWNEGIEEVFKMYYENADADRMFAPVEQLHLQLDHPETSEEVSFKNAYARDLQEALGWFSRYRRTQNQTYLKQSLQTYRKVLKSIVDQLPQMMTLELPYVSPSLLAAKDMDLAIPGSYKAGEPIVQIKSFSPAMQVLASKQRPRKLTVYGSDGKEYQYLLKGHEDLRQDERVMQLFGLVNRLLQSDQECFKRHLNITQYAVIPLSQNSGLIGWVQECDTMHALVKDYRKSRKIILDIEYRLMQKMTTQYDALCTIQKVEVFEYALDNTSGQDLMKILWLKSSSSETWLARRTTYTRSLAVMSMVGYILGLGDRHPSNLMIQRHSGEVIHVDFGDCFEVAMDRDRYPEKIPFRLTRMLIKAMEVSGIHGTFKITSNNVMRLLRDNKESLMAVLEAFISDPLISMRLRTGANNNNNPSPRRRTQALDEEPMVHTTANNRPVRSSYVGSVRRRQGDIDDPSQNPDTNNVKAMNVIKRIENKLTGRDFKLEKQLNVEQQVEKLIAEARDNEKLCQCYVGWCPFW
ncbi:phosphatidylinositol kinase- protein kinase tor1 [Nowakowskiella sp. JEL0407]|nr:phosphatidylinositol kinase- protein kinase tor1 [Nowakowskiella sp. JEL0407]